MPIHDQGYRHYAGRRDRRSRVWWVIARAGLMERLRERRMLGLLLASWLPFLVRSVQMYIAANYSQASFLAPSAQMFREYLDQQNIFVFFITVFVGAGLIANDRRANALQIYFSKPLTRVEYVTGKLVVLALLLAAITWLPGMLLLLLQMMFAGNTTFVRANVHLFPAITLFAAIQVFLSSFAMLALSSLSKSRRFVSIMYTGVVFFSAAMYQALQRITGRSWAWLSPQDTLDVLGDAIFRIPKPAAMPVPVAFLAVAVLIAASIWILERRVRGVEVVV